ncbi:MAG: chemotaxis protein CheW [Firmicutes bacterium]|jgi:purine-binding chemotaxis protein CheW|nr:chemotaxis protein CheW [Bacillota bacterium]
MTDEARAKADEHQLVVFGIANELYGVDIAAVREIITMQRITRVPRTPDFVEGIINLRGKVIPVIDLRKRFRLGVAEENKETRIVVVEIQGNTIGMVVDSVSEVLRISGDVLEPPSPVIVGVDSEYIQAVAKVEDRLIILLDMEKVLNRQEQVELKAVS